MLQICVSIVIFLVFLAVSMCFSVIYPSAFKLFTLKTLLTHLPSLSFLSYLRLSYPPAVTYFLHSLTYFCSLLVSDLPLSCLFAVSVYSKAIVATLLLPLLALINVLACWMATKAWRINAAIATSNSLFLTIFAALEVLTTMVSCGEVETEELVLFFDMDEVCWRGTHLKMVYCLVIPGIILNVLFPLASQHCSTQYHASSYT